MPDSNSVSSSRFWLAIIALTIVASGLRLNGIQKAGFWLDEVLHIPRCFNLDAKILNVKALGFVPTELAFRSWGIDTRELRDENRHEWQKMGVSHFNARIASCLIGILSIPLLALASRSLLGPFPAVVLAALLAFAPWHIIWSQCARYYTQQFLFYNLAIIWYFLGTRQQSSRHLFACASMVFLSFMTQPTGIIILGIFVTDYLYARFRGHPYKMSRASLIVFVLTTVVCFLLVLRDQVAPGHLNSKFTRNSPQLIVLYSTFLIGPPLVALVLASLQGLIRRTEPLTVYLLMSAVLPMVIIEMMSSFSFVFIRYVFIALYAWLALGALVVVELYGAIKPGHGRLMAWSPCVALLAYSAMMYSIGNQRIEGYNPPWQEAYQYVAKHREAGDLISSDKPKIAQYYLEDPAMPVDPGSLDEVGETVWIVFLARSPRPEGLEKQLADAELKRVLPMKMIGTTRSVFVYRRPPIPGGVVPSRG